MGNYAIAGVDFVTTAGARQYLLLFAGAGLIALRRDSLSSQ